MGVSRTGSSAKRTALVISSAYPPTPRLRKLEEHLPLFGWRTEFLVPSRGGRDLRLLTEEAWDAKGQLGTVKERSSRGASLHSGLPRLFLADNFMTRRLRLALLWLHTPDAFAPWLPVGVAGGLWMTRKEAPSAILASGPPFSMVCAGVALKRLTGLPLMLDFRDAWTLDPIDPIGCLDGSFRAPISLHRRAVLRKLEATALLSADEVLFTSDQTFRAYRAALPALDRKGRVLYNGTDEGGFDQLPTREAPFALTYVGTLHHFQQWQAELILRAFARLLHTPPKDDLVLRFFGHRAPALDSRLRGLARELAVADHAEFGGPIPRDRGVRLLRARGVQLLFAGSSRLTRLTKISECLATGRPLLALAASDSETAEHVRRAGQQVYSGSSVDGLVALMTRLRQEPSALSFPPLGFPFSYPHPLHWRSVAEAVAASLDRLVDHPSGRS